MKLLLTGLLLACPSTAQAEEPLARPVIATGVPAPTRDKPQSKLWHARGNWWAWLPSKNGSAIWRRELDGWRQIPGVADQLNGLPASADVDFVGDTAYAVLLERPSPAKRCQLFFAAFRIDATSGGRVTERSLIEADAQPIETATIAHDPRRNWIWVAYTMNRRVQLRRRDVDGKRVWSDPIVVANDVDGDDICSLGRIGDRVIVVWSDQRHDRMGICELTGSGDVVEQVHATIASGAKIADDHINVHATPAGQVLVASKNSVDHIGKPQLALHWRDLAKHWQTMHYATLTGLEAPSRPILAIAPSQQTLFAIHSVYVRRGGRGLDRIDCIPTSLQKPDLNAPPITLIRAAERLNDPTGTKQALPADLPWYVLASDKKGNVYEGILPKPGASLLFRRATDSKNR